MKEKAKRVLRVVEVQMKEQGVDVEKHSERISKITQALMLVEQTLWYRIQDDEKIVKMISSFEDDLEKTMEMISKHGFKDLVYTYRTTNTNLYTYKLKNEQRWYKLSKKDFQKFLKDIEKGDLKVISKPKASVSTKTKASVKKDTKSKLAMLIEEPKEQVKKEQVKKDHAKKAKKTTTKKVNEKLKEIQFDESEQTFIEKVQEKDNTRKVSKKKGWVEHDLSKALDPKVFIKIKMKDDTNKFVRYQSIKAKKNGAFDMIVNDHGKETTIDVLSISKVYTYVK